MKVLENENELSGVERGLVWFEHTFFSEMSEKLSAGNILHEEVNVLAVLVHTFEVDDKWMADRSQDLKLVTDMIHLLGLD